MKKSLMLMTIVLLILFGVSYVREEPAGVSADRSLSTSESKSALTAPEAEYARHRGRPLPVPYNYITIDEDMPGSPASRTYVGTGNPAPTAQPVPYYFVIDESHPDQGRTLARAPEGEPEPYEAVPRVPPAAEVAASRAGRVRGRVTLAGEASFGEEGRPRVRARNGLPNAVVIIRAAAGNAERTGRTLVINDEEYCAIRPHVLAVQTGAKTFLMNAGALPHRIRLEAGANITFDETIRPGESREFAFRVPEDMGIFCSLHRGARSWIVAVDTPCFAVTDGAGEFSIDDVPSGTHDVRVWHEHYGEQRSAVTVEPGRETELNVELSGS